MGMIEETKDALTVPAQILITESQRVKLRTLRRLGIVSGVVIRRALDGVLAEYAPLLESARAQNNQEGIS